MNLTLARSTLWLAALLLLLGACVPLDPDTKDAAPAATAAPEMAAPIPAGAAPAEVVSATTATTDIVTPTISSNLVLTTPATVEVATPISPDHSIIGPVGEPQTHDMPGAPESQGIGGRG